VLAVKEPGNYNLVIMAIASINPATGETLKTFTALTAEQIEEKLQLAADTFRTYLRTTFADRKPLMMRAAEILETRKHDFGKIMTLEMGKPLKAAIGEAEKCAWVCRYYAENAEHHLSDQIVETNAQKSYVHFQPLGPVLAVMPWNFPFWQVFRFAAPALMAGNVGLLKHASNVPQCALAIEEIFASAGFPKGAFQTLLIGSDAVEGILNDPRVVAATLTGSEPAGRSVAATAGKQIKKTVLELGGSDPFIVMPSANLDEAVTTAVKARTINNGQSCIAAKRFIVADDIYDEFEKRFVEEMRALKIGDPMDETVEIGPLATPQIVNDLDEQVKKAVASGARVLTGGKKIEGRGKARLPLREQVPEALVGLLGGAEAGEHAHRPRTAAVHRRLNAAGERPLTGITEVRRVIHAGVLGSVNGFYWDSRRRELLAGLVAAHSRRPWRRR